MALLWLDSFDDRSTNANYLLKYDSAAGTLAPLTGGRTGKGVTFTGSSSGSISKNFSARGSYTIGFGLRVSTPPNAGVAFLQFWDGANLQCYLQITSGSTLEFRRGGDNVILATTVNVLSSSLWTHVEAKIIVHSSTGAIVLNFQGTPDLNVTGLNTRHALSTNNTAGTITLFNNNAGAALDLDDLYIGDLLGANNTGLLGQVKIECLKPSASGTWNQWTPLAAGQNYLQINEADPDGDTTFNAAASGGLVDTYRFPLLSLAVSGATLPGLQLGLWARKDDTALRKLNAVARSGATMYDAAPLFTMTNSYAFCPTIYETDPFTTVAWTSGGIGLAEFGVKVAV